MSDTRRPERDAMMDDATLANIERIVVGEYPCAYCPALIKEIRRLREALKRSTDDFVKPLVEQTQADLAAHRAVVRELVQALARSVVALEMWHGMGMSGLNRAEAWKIYYDHSPEMKEIRVALAHPLVQQARERRDG